VGPLVILVWYNLPALKQAVYELIPAFGLSLLAAVVVSWATWEQEKDWVRPGN